MKKDKKLLPTNAMLPAVFCARDTNNFLILIPKKKGKGYLKSCFGWHSKNKAANIFDDEKPDWFVTGDTCDLDAHLSIELKVRWWEKGFDKGIKETIAALQKSFPYVKEWKEDCELFWREVKKNCG